MRRLIVLRALVALAGCASVGRQPDSAGADNYSVDSNIESIEVFNGRPPRFIGPQPESPLPRPGRRETPAQG